MNDFRERCLGKCGPTVGPIGIGTWAIGGPFWSGKECRYPTGAPLGYGKVDDEESARAVHCAIDLGARLFDTADAYGAGHSESVLGSALRGKRDQVLIATKFGNTYNAETKELTGTNVSPNYIRQACSASLKRLHTDWIDLYQLHLGDLPADQAEGVADTLDALSDEGLIRFYAWSTDNAENAAVFGERTRAVALQFDLNIFQDAPEMIVACDAYDYAGVIRAPLAMGFLSGKHTSKSKLPNDDIRSHPPAWLKYFEKGGSAAVDWSYRLESIKEILTSNGRTMTQGALAWVWARHARTIPIPGVRTVAQVEENLGAVEFGPLDPNQMEEIKNLMNRS
ncbi:MAG: aldo/keto reductase [Pseudomonadota bacterium]